MPSLSIPTPGGAFTLEAEPGCSFVFVGANGSGKTRLGAYLEGVRRGNNRDVRRGYDVHRVSAQRVLAMDPVDLVNLERAERALHQGSPENEAEDLKCFHRWNREPVVGQLNDFGHVLRVLFAEHMRELALFGQRHDEDPAAKRNRSRLDRAVELWHSLFSHRRVQIVENTLRVLPDRRSNAVPYEAAQLSDGERVAFYLIGQVLAAPRGALLVVDEPELHVHRALLPSLWDRLEAARRDLVFVHLTHDLEFAASRRDARKFALLEYARTNAPDDDGVWTLRELPGDDGPIDEELVARVLGSRRPVLFVEGGRGSLDPAIYRRAYPDWSVVPVGDCESVMHAVATFNAHPALHRARCAGIVDADARDGTERAYLAARSVHVLSVSEVENLFLSPEVFRALAAALGFRGPRLEEVVDAAARMVLERARAHAGDASLRRVRRVIDRRMKAVGLAAESLAALREEFASATGAIDIGAVYAEAQLNLLSAVDRGDADAVLALYDDNGLLAEAARLLDTKKKALEKRILDLLSSEDDHGLADALKQRLPVLGSLADAASAASSEGGSGAQAA